MKLKNLLSTIAAGLLLLCVPAGATIWNYELDLTANYADDVPLPNGDPMLGVYYTPPFGQVFKATFSLNSVLLIPGSLSTIPLESLHFAAGDAVWNVDDLIYAYFITDIYRNILTMSLFAVTPDGDGFGANYKTGRPNLDTFTSSWVAIDSYFPSCVISTDFSFSGPCFGSVNNDIKLVKLPDGEPGGGGGGNVGVPEPAPWILTLTGIALLGGRARRRSC